MVVLLLNIGKRFLKLRIEVEMGIGYHDSMKALWTGRNGGIFPTVDSQNETQDNSTISTYPTNRIQCQSHLDGLENFQDKQGFFIMSLDLFSYYGASFSANIAYAIFKRIHLDYVDQDFYSVRQC